MCTGLDRIENRGIAKGKEIGKEIGEKEERQRMLQLIQYMAEKGEVDLIPELSKKPEFLQEMYQKYNLL